MKTRTNSLRKDWGSGGRERGKRNRPLLSHGPSSGKLKVVPPLCECSFLQMLGPDAVHLLGVRRKPPEHMAAHISLHPGTDWGSRSPGLCFQSCDNSCEKPREWQALSSLLTSQRESEGSFRGLLLFGDSVSTRGREHSGLWFYPQWEGARKGNSCGSFSQFKILIGVNRVMDPKYICVRIPGACELANYLAKSDWVVSGNTVLCSFQMGRAACRPSRRSPYVWKVGRGKIWGCPPQTPPAAVGFEDGGRDHKQWECRKL